jgi:hypothetical protein
MTPQPRSPRQTPKPRAKKAQAQSPPALQADDDDVELPEDVDAHIKAEKEWEGQFV